MAASKFQVDASGRKRKETELNSGIGNDAGNNPNSRSRLALPRAVATGGHPFAGAKEMDLREQVAIFCPRFSRWRPPLVRTGALAALPAFGFGGLDIAREISANRTRSCSWERGRIALTSLRPSLESNSKMHGRIEYPVRD